MGKIVRALSADGGVLCSSINSTDIVNEIQKIHNTTPVVSAALGRMTTAASIMGAMLKYEGDSLTLRINGGGPCGSMIAVSDYKGNVKSYVANNNVELPLNAKGKLDVGKCVGTDGYLAVVKDMGLKEPYCGQIPLVSGEIAEDVTAYYATSEQIPTVCALGVLVDTDWSIKVAGGYIIQVLPPVNDKAIDVIENNIRDMQSITEMLEKGMTSEEIAMKALDGLEPSILDEWDAVYKCDCSRERIERALISMGRKDLESLAEEQETTEVCCHFCNKKYEFTKNEIYKLLNP